MGGRRPPSTDADADADAAAGVVAQWFQKEGWAGLIALGTLSENLETVDGRYAGCCA